MDKKNNSKKIDLSSYILNQDNSSAGKGNGEPARQEQQGQSELRDVNYWRSFSELYKDPEFKKARDLEFVEGADGKPEIDKMSGMSRRKFLALMSASAALAAAGCSNYRDKGEIIPYNKQPEGIVIGNPNYYASTLSYNGIDYGVLIKTREGRPIKIDGNPDHPVSKGKTSVRVQASILDMYSPDRLKEPMFSSTREGFKKIEWSEADGNIVQELTNAASSGKEIAVIAGSITSPTLTKLLADFKTAYPTTKVYSYELFDEETKDSAWRKTYGAGKYPVIQYDRAKVIVALEHDFLGAEGNTPEQVRGYTANRDIVNKEDFNRLYSIEGNVSITGMNADYRLRLRSDLIEEFVMALTSELINKKGLSSANIDSAVRAKVQSFNLEDFSNKHQLPMDAVSQMAEDLMKHRGESIITAGSALPESTHIVINFLNEALGNTEMYSYDNEVSDGIVRSSITDLDNLANSMSSGNVGVAIHLDSNPVFNFPAEYNYGELLKNVPTVISITEVENETSKLSNYVLPASHQLESWGDFRTRVSYYALQQPVISPLFNNRQKEAMLLTWLNGAPNSYNDNVYHLYLKDNWEKNIYPAFGVSTGFNQFWLSSLHDGVALTNKEGEASGSGITAVASDTTGTNGTQQTSATRTQFNPSAFVNIQAMMAGGGFVLQLKESEAVGDGSFANNGWLQELPHPVSKIVWDNYAAISPDTADGMGLKSYDMAEISIDGRIQKVPVFVQPGMADNQVTIELGYGRTSGGTVAEGVGVDANVLMGKTSKISRWLYSDAQVTPAEGTYELVATVEHYPIEHDRYKDIQFDRHIIQEGTLKQYKENPEFLKEANEEELKMGNSPSISGAHTYTGVKWAMAIDLNKCIGCNECIIACNVENNIPVVGKEQVKLTREMTWMRIDRYYSGSVQNPRASFQPMLCQHCDFAPCENVCPVKATTHTEDGINGMAYNRCVGTRYCSNNCPYKVRRYNYFNFRDEFKDEYQQQEPLSLMMNPEVTVRSRGVMEKCTFCIQRVMHARQVATEEGRELKGTDVVTACQDACVSSAIHFGDMNDASAELQKYRNHNLAYHVLEAIKVTPNVTYIAKLRNTEEEIKEEAMEDGH